MNKLEDLVFNVGIGETTRRCALPVEKLAWLGVKLDVSANDRNGPRISIEDSCV
jgi:acetate kinase